ncbi:MAG TPA: glycosyltransferase family 2 protein [Polyangiaceae bacterium]|nr:glycosyltransferase family 2 protein [Polyangiaceae bacterium]
MTHTVLRAVVICLLLGTVPAHLYGVYAVALFVLSRLRGDRAPAPDASATPRLASLLIAHDEERVIANSVKALVAQRYAPGKSVAFVVADRCTDRTAEFARREGARVLERASGPGGKSPALAFGIESIAHEAFDAIAVFDADNLADEGFLAAIAPRLATERVVQGFVDSMNPEASWVASSSALGFWAIAELSQAPRERLGLSTPLMGTGFAIEMGLARTLLTTGGGLTDDLELAARLANSGVRVAYEARARTVDEKPVRLGTAVAQRRRWMQGRWAVAFQHGPALLREATRQRELRTALRILDVALQLVAPSLLFTGVFTALLSALALGVARLDGFAAPFATISLSAAALYYAVPAFAIARHKPGWRVWLCYVSQAFYLVLSLPLAVSGFLTRRERSWVRTPKGPESA